MALKQTSLDWQPVDLTEQIHLPSDKFVQKKKHQISCSQLNHPTIKDIAIMFLQHIDA